MIRKRSKNFNDNAWEPADIQEMDPTDPDDVEYHDLLKKIWALKHKPYKDTRDVRRGKAPRADKRKQAVTIWHRASEKGMKTLTELREELKALTNKD